MSVMDDFSSFAFERARGKYDRAEFDEMTTDDWVALVETYRRAREKVCPCTEPNCGCDD